MGRRIPADVEITESRPNDVHAFRATEGPVRPEGTYELSPADGGTRVRFVLVAEVRGLKKLMAPMVQRTMDREVGGLEQLKRVLER
jgi:polyketide cyclase/dehydrase/lipid transport protein